MTIQIDTREHQGEYERIIKQFDALNVPYFRSKLYVGDYLNLDNPRLVIDRKKDLQEVVGNVTQQHKRFREELIRAQEAGIKIIVLIEHGNGINTLEDVFFWRNPRKHEVKWRMVNGKRVKSVASSTATDGEQLYKILNTMRERYGVEFRFCEKKDTGRTIKELLE